MLLPVVFPDAELVVVTHLRPRLDPVEVHVQVPTDRPDQFLTIRRSGGTADRLTDRPLIDVFAWARTDEDAKDLAQLALAHMGAIRGRHAGVSVQGVTEYAGLSPAPDQSAQPRWTFSVELSIRGVAL